ncbi:allantoate amidohydrolase [Undibacterium sp. SXout7W]|uniref:allantoate amidohydrolase n=1 Tax=Undibacterium sp. SXout7W TaxID=3413049 RepID=UPI003BF1B847
MPQNVKGITIMRRADELALHTEAPGMLTRTFLTHAHQGAAATLTEWMREAGMHVRRDAVGNVIGRYEGLTPDAPALLTGSHFDTVKNAGKYDGNLGILLPITCVAEWHRQGRRFPFAIEVIGFAEEEGVRYKATLLGSRAIAGKFDESLLDKVDEQGIRMRDAISIAGFDATTIKTAAFNPEKVLGFVEVHIEQGPVLLNEHLAVGIVTAISGASRFMVIATGLAGHAGTVPMNLRRDAAMAAAEIGLYIEKCCSGIPGLVGTVGQFDVPNGAANTVPGKAIWTIDIRAESDDIRLAAVNDVMAKMKEIADRRDIHLDIQQTHDAISVPCAKNLQQQLAAAIKKNGIPVRYLPSGAGHDAMAIASLTEVAMLFVRCGRGGISHHPDEIMTAEDAELAAQVFSNFIEQFAHPTTDHHQGQ